ncbi:MAG: DedA family protein [Candidatus Omnitrophica bacterium]|nr:DedA family protein [Candidatus Omnitrophota bacterium]MDD5653326.1 DedA family protein [Candidatus Omnitrophota bacterium]
MENLLQADINSLIRNFGDIGLFLGMFLESSIFPIPSEAVVVAAGAIGIPLASIIIFGSLGATLGSIVGYSIGRYAAVPVILRYGKFVFIKPHHLQKAEAFAKKYGPWSVFLGRLLPIIPFKVFSVSAGIAKLPFIPFIICTMLGVLPRMYLLGVFGSVLIKYKRPAFLVLIAAIAIFFIFRLKKQRQ